MRNLSKAAYYSKIQMTNFDGEYLLRVHVLGVFIDNERGNLLNAINRH
jgi:hypothetical protein